MEKVKTKYSTEFTVGGVTIKKDVIVTIYPTKNLQYVGIGEISKVIKALIEKKLGYKIKTVSKEYSGGESIRIILPKEATIEDIENAKKIGYKFLAGRFDGNDDSYNYLKDKDIKIGEYNIDFTVKFVFIEKEED